MKQAVVLINYGNQGFLTCSRRYSKQFSFIGGKIENGETPIEALIRETKEETGIDIFEKDITLVKNMVEIDGYESYIYFSTLNDLKPYENEEGIIPKFRTIEEIKGKEAYFQEFNLSFLKNFKDVTIWSRKIKGIYEHNHYEEGIVNVELKKPMPINNEFKLQNSWINFDWKKTKGFLVYNNIIEVSND